MQMIRIKSKPLLFVIGAMVEVILTLAFCSALRLITWPLFRPPVFRVVELSTLIISFALGSVPGGLIWCQAYTLKCSLVTSGVLFAFPIFCLMIALDLMMLPDIARAGSHSFGLKRKFVINLLVVPVIAGGLGVLAGWGAHTLHTKFRFRTR
jgi:hypothetical protein